MLCRIWKLINLSEVFRQTEKVCRHNRSSAPFIRMELIEIHPLCKQHTSIRQLFSSCIVQSHNKTHPYVNPGESIDYRPGCAEI